MFNKIPLFIYWDTGLEHSTPIVRKCYETWKLVLAEDPQWELVSLSDSNLSEYVSEEVIKLKNTVESLQAFSDVLRIYLLQRYGGMWVDSTVICLKHPSKWIDLSDDFFAFRNPTSGRRASTWCLWAKKDSIIAKKWWESVVKYWSNVKTASLGYFWAHKLFNNLYKNDAEFSHIWNSSKNKRRAGALISDSVYIQTTNHRKIQNGQPVTSLDPKGQQEISLPARKRILQIYKRHPVLKFDWRLDVLTKTNLYVLLSLINKQPKK